MFVSLWSAKGGVGTTVVAAALAVLLAGADDGGALLVDLDGEAPAALGLPDPPAAGLGAWFASGDAVPPDGLGRLEVPVGSGLSVLARGEGPLGDLGRAELLAALLAAEPRAVVVDCGRLGGGADDEVRRALAAAAPHSLLVTRPCYLGLRRALALPVRPSGVVLVAEPGRALGADDVEHVLEVPVVLEVPLDPAVARAVDAGLLAARVPRSLARALRSLT